MRLRAASVVIASLPLAAVTATAGVITQTFTFGNGSALLFDPFDPSVGVLDEVRVAIDGRVTLRVSSQQVCVPCAPVPAFPPVPGFVDATQQIGGSGPFSGLSTTYQWLFTANVGTPLITDIVEFDYAFAFTETTDLLGFALMGASFLELTPGPPDRAAFLPPLIVSGTRDDFVSAVPLPLIVTMIVFGSATSGFVPSIATFELSGSMSVEYEYTSVAANVAEPSTLFLLGVGAGVTGLAAQIRSRRRRALSRK